MNAEAVTKITNIALEIAAKTASNLMPGESFSAADIAASISADPTGETALYVAKLIATGVQHYELFLSIAA